MQYSVAIRVHNLTVILSYLYGFRVIEYVQKSKLLQNEYYQVIMVYLNYRTSCNIADKVKFLGY